MKFLDPSLIIKFEQIPNVGPRIAKDFRTLGIKTPAELAKQDAFALYTKLQKITKSKQDPCVLDTFMAVVAFMNGTKAMPWWHYTKERKAMVQKKAYTFE